MEKFWRLTFCWNNAVNKMVDLALYSKGWVEASHSNLTTTKGSHLECTITFTYVCLLKDASHYCLYPHRDAAGILEAA